MKEERPIVRSGRRGSAALAVLAVFFTSVLSPATAEAAAKTTGKVEAALNPLEMGWIWDANVNRIPGGNSGDIIMSLSAGAEAAAMPVEGDVLEGRLEMNITGARYLQNPNYSNLTNRFSMAAEIRPKDFRILLRKTYLVRRSRLADLDYWDDLYHGQGRWSPGGGFSALLRYDYQTHICFDGRPEYQARQNRLNAFAGELEKEWGGHFHTTVSLERSLQDFNRYALAVEPSGWSILPQIQHDNGWTYEASLRLYAVKVLQQLQGRDARILSNSYGCSYRVRSLTWAAVWKPRAGLLVELKARAYEKTYDREPLGIPEYGRGWTDEEGEDLASVMLRHELKKHWILSAGYAWIEAEAGRPGWNYRKQKGSFSVSRSF